LDDHRYGFPDGRFRLLLGTLSPNLWNVRRCTYRRTNEWSCDAESLVSDPAGIHSREPVAAARSRLPDHPIAGHQVGELHVGLISLYGPAQNQISIG
jgi:hypothetical protein